MSKGQTNPNSLANLKPAWKKGESGNPKGRPKDRVREMLKKMLPKKILQQNGDLKWFEVDSIEKAVLSLRLADIQALAKADETPAYMKSLAMAIVIDMKNGRTATVDRLRDRQYGAVKQQIDIAGEMAMQDKVEERSIEEIRAERKRLERALAAAMKGDKDKEVGG